MNNRIVYEPSFKIREVARKALAGNWQKVYVGIFIYYLLGTFIGDLLSMFFDTTQYYTMPNGEIVRISVSFASGIYDFVVGGPLMCGLAMFLLAFFRERQVNYGLTLEGFSMFGKGFILYLLYSVKIFLWSLLFVIPGIIAALRYSQAFYLRVDHPDWTASQCIAESSRLMMGNKGKYFGLMLSFIGWMILACIPMGLAEEFLYGGEIMTLIYGLIVALPVLVVETYMSVTQVGFYEILTGRLVILHNDDNEQYYANQEYSRENSENKDETQNH